MKAAREEKKPSVEQVKEEPKIDFKGLVDNQFRNLQVENVKNEIEKIARKISEIRGISPADEDVHQQASFIIGKIRKQIIFLHLRLSKRARLMSGASGMLFGPGGR